jgi:hypothetical protein
MPADLCEALLVTATQAILLQERYSLVAACKFLVRLCLAFFVFFLTILRPCYQVTFVKRSTSDDTTHDGALALLTSHGQRIVNALVYGIASDAPRSAIPNLASVMSIIVSKLPAESRVWLQLAMQSVSTCSKQLPVRNTVDNIRLQIFTRSAIRNMSRRILGSHRPRGMPFSKPSLRKHPTFAALCGVSN